jgi:hypothetical protein
MNTDGEVFIGTIGTGSAGGVASLVSRLTIAGATGAATFSSSVKVNGTPIATSGILSVVTSTSSIGATADLGLLITNDGTNGKMSQIGFGYSESKTGAVIGGIITSGAGSTSSALFFGTRDTTDGATAPTERMRITSGGALAVGTTDIPTLSTPNGGQLIVMPNAVIVSGIIALGSPYTQNIQIDIVYNNWGGNNVIGLVDMIITLREYANTGGTAFGKVFAVNSGSGATFSSFNTTNVTTSQCSVTATSGGNYTLRITIDPSNVTDRGSFYLTIPNAGGTGSSINSITVSYV